ncbi:ACS family tartrate transporter-like MFS transporter [Caballeronia udeis]|uniref:ACS family tartrate transporter-like MFS transporter n=1 Tax=Caballeronia udeis TaxID=1232866 RepID=A0ABW8MIY7_9BURK
MKNDTVVIDSGVTIPGSIEDKAFRKAILRLVPLLTISFLVNYIDRTNVGFAALTMNHDIGLSNMAFGWGAGVLFFSYCFFEVPSNAVLYRVGARIWLARIMITWGILSAATALVSGPRSFYLMRFLLGAAEAGFNPGVMFFFLAWFPVRYRSRILAWFQMAIPLSAVVSGPLSIAVLQANGLLGLAGWQWLFIVEGVPAVILGVAVLVMVTDQPKDAAWLTPDERQAITAAVAAETRERAVIHFRDIVTDPRVLLLTAIQFGFTLGSYGIGIWLPLILKEHKLSTLSIGLVAAVPYMIGCFATILWASAVDRSGRRIFHLALTCGLAALGMLIAVSVPTLAVSMLGLTIAIVGVTSARGIFWSIPPRFLSGKGAASGLALISSVATLGGFLGPVTMGWLRTTTGSFTTGLVCMAALIAMSGLLTLLLPRFMKGD